MEAAEELEHNRIGIQTALNPDNHGVILLDSGALRNAEDARCKHFIPQPKSERITPRSTPVQGGGHVHNRP